MTILATRKTQHFAANGTLLGEDTVQVDVTAETIRDDIRTKARAALTANANFLAIASPTNAQVLAQTKLLTRQASAIIRLIIALDGSPDLLVENTDT